MKKRILALQFLIINLVIGENMSASQTITIAKPVESSAITTVNKIVAFVNKGVITENQVNLQIAQVLDNFRLKKIIPPSVSDIRSKVIDQLIMQKIQLDLADRSGIKTNDIEVTNAINNIVKGQNTNLETFKANLAKQGLSFSDFREQVQNEIILEKLKQREVDGRITVNEDEVTRVLNSEAYKNKIDYNLSDILITIPEQATSEEISQKENLANQVYIALKAGQSFNQLSVKYSNGPNALTGGELGWKSSATLPLQIAYALKDLKPGEVTNVVKLPVGFFIFKLNEVKKHGTPQIVRQYEVRHILIKVNENMSDSEAHQKILSIKALLDKDKNNQAQLNSDFIKYAKDYSEDTSSINGGDIGWVSRGDTVPAFESGILNTPVGVVSNPILTPFGWHLLQVIGIRDSNLTNDREKAEIRQELHETKASLFYSQWLRDIRDMAYVKINDE